MPNGQPQFDPNTWTYNPVTGQYLDPTGQWTYDPSLAEVGANPYSSSVGPGAGAGAGAGGPGGGGSPPPWEPGYPGPPIDYGQYGPGASIAATMGYWGQQPIGQYVPEWLQQTGTSLNELIMGGLQDPTSGPFADINRKMYDLGAGRLGDVFAQQERDITRGYGYGGLAGTGLHQGALRRQGQDYTRALGDLFTGIETQNWQNLLGAGMGMYGAGLGQERARGDIALGERQLMGQTMSNWYGGR